MGLLDDLDTEFAKPALCRIGLLLAAEEPDGEGRHHLAEALVGPYSGAAVGRALANNGVQMGPGYLGELVNTHRRGGCVCPS